MEEYTLHVQTGVVVADADKLIDDLTAFLEPIGASGAALLYDYLAGELSATFQYKSTSAGAAVDIAIEMFATAIEVSVGFRPTRIKADVEPTVADEERVA